MTLMKYTLTFCLVCLLLSTACRTEKNQGYIFFLHNRFLEDHAATEAHPAYGVAAYDEVIHEFEKENFVVISEKRKGNADVTTYAMKVKKQIDSLLARGISPSEITVIGTSKGGYIAQYVSTFARNPNLNFVFIACYTDADLQGLPAINFCGNILTIFEKSDPIGRSALKRKEKSTCDIKHFREIELNTGLKHGFLFKPLPAWIKPCIAWAKGNYELK
jgi:hypothetical protein